MTTHTIAALAGAALALGACNPGVDVHTLVSPEASQDQPRSVSVMPTVEYLGGRTPYEFSPLLNNAAADKALRSDLVRGLARRGFVVSDSAPDALVVYYLAVPDQGDFSDWSFDYIWRPGWWRGWGAGPADATPAEYADGALVIEMVDARTGQVLWRQHTVAPVPGRERRYERSLAQRVAALLARLPERAPSSG